MVKNENNAPQDQNGKVSTSQSNLNPSGPSHELMDLGDVFHRVRTELTRSRQLPTAETSEYGPLSSQQLRQETLRLIASDPLIDLKKLSSLPPTTQVVLADVASNHKRELLQTFDNAVRKLTSAGLPSEVIAERLHEEISTSVEKASTSLGQMMGILSDARYLPMAAMYASARTTPFANHTRAVEAVGIIVDHLMNNVRPDYAPEYSPGVSIVNGGGDTGGMRYMNDAVLASVGSPEQTDFPARGILIPLQIRTDRERPYTKVHPAAWQTPGIDCLGPRTLSILSTGNQHPLQRSSSSVTFPCGGGGLEETLREYSELAAGRNNPSLLCGIQNGKRQVHIVSERGIFTPIKEFFDTQVAIGAFEKDNRERVHVWELGEPGQDAETAAKKIGESFLEVRETPRPVYLNSEQEKEIAYQITQSLWESHHHPMTSPLFTAPGSERHPTEVAADNLYRKVVELSAIEKGLRYYNQSRGTLDEAVDLAKRHIDKEADGLLELMQRVGTRPTVTIMGHSQEIDSRSKRLLTPELKLITLDLVDDLVRNGISIVLTGEGELGVNQIVSEAFKTAQQRYNNHDSLLIRSRITNRDTAEQMPQSQLEQVTPALQGLWGNTIVKTVLGIPVANIALGPVSDDQIGNLGQTLTDGQLAGITRSIVNGLPMYPDTFVISGHYQNAPEGNYEGLQKQYEMMVERGTMDAKDLYQHHFLSSKDPLKTIRQIRGHAEAYHSLIR